LSTFADATNHFDSWRSCPGDTDADCNRPRFSRRRIHRSLRWLHRSLRWLHRSLRWLHRSLRWLYRCSTPTAPSGKLTALAAPSMCAAGSVVWEATRRRPVAVGRSTSARAPATGSSNPFILPFAPLIALAAPTIAPFGTLHRHTRDDDPTNRGRRLPQTNRWPHRARRWGARLRSWPAQSHAWSLHVQPSSLPLPDGHLSGTDRSFPRPSTWLPCAGYLTAPREPLTPARESATAPREPLIPASRRRTPTEFRRNHGACSG